MVLFLLATGCASGPYAAPTGSTVTHLTEGQGLVLDAASVPAGDGIGHLVLEQALVEIPSGEDMAPGNNIQVEVVSGWAGAYLISEGAVKVVTEVEEACPEGTDDPACDAWFDAEGNAWYEFSGEYEDVDDFRPTYLSGASDHRGVFSWYVFIDSVPLDENGEPLVIPIYVSIGVDSVAYEYDFD